MTDLRVIPGVGKETKKDLYKMGYRHVEDLIGKDPEKLYEENMKVEGTYIDRCQLYVFRCAVYYAEGGREEAKLKWWNWKD